MKRRAPKNNLPRFLIGPEEPKGQGAQATRLGISFETGISKVE
jgi:hypothetical protein